MKKTVAVYLYCVIISISGAYSAFLDATVSNHTLSLLSSNNNETNTPSLVISTTLAPTTTISTKTKVVPTTTDNPTTPTPILPVDPKPYKWVVNGTNSTIIVQMAVKLIIIYQNSTSKQNASLEIALPGNNNTEALGNFVKSDETLKLSWNISTNASSYILLHFKRSAKTYALNDLEVFINSTALNTTFKLAHRQEHFNTSIGNSYRCIRLQTFNLTGQNNSAVSGFMKVSDLQFEAFKADKKATFGLAEDCAFDTPDIVPIAVGCVLAGLVVIVLAAYLISRRRSEARGYLSM